MNVLLLILTLVLCFEIATHLGRIERLQLRMEHRNLRIRMVIFSVVLVMMATIIVARDFWLR